MLGVGDSSFQVENDISVYEIKELGVESVVSTADCAMWGGEIVSSHDEVARGGSEIESLIIE